MLGASGGAEVSEEVVKKVVLQLVWEETRPDVR